MKTLFALLTLALFVSGSVLSQNNCINEVSTNPNSPVNNSLPITIDSDPNVDDRFLNSFIWYEQANIPLENMLPVYPPNMTHLRFDSHPYYHYLSQGEQLTTENGWELVLFNTGHYPDLSPMDDTGNQDLPYIVLYNRFTGKLRVFGTYGVSPIVNGGMSFDGLRISLRFDLPNDEVSGNFRLLDGKDKPLDQTTEVIMSESMALHPNSPSQWFSADFQIAYDPCVCYYPSGLRLRFEFFESMELKLYGRSITVDDEIANGNDLLTNDFLSNFQFPDGTNDDAQIVMYKVMEDFVDDYIEKLEKYQTDLADVQEYNKEVDRKLVVLKLFKNVVIQGGTYVVTALTGMPWFPQLVQSASNLIPPIEADSAAIAGYKKSLITATKKIIGSGVDSFIKKNFKKKPEPSKPDPPTASFSEMRMTGTLVDNIDILKQAFYTPGTYGSEGTGTPVLNSPFAYPIYNEALGTFALLNTPKIKAFKSSGEVLNEYYAGRQYKSWGRFIQFQLSNDLYYALNDINIVSHSVKAGIEIKSLLEPNLATLSTVPTNVYMNDEHFINLTSEQVNNGEYYPVHVNDGKGYNGGANYCGGTPESLGLCTYEEFNLANTVYNKDTLTFQSDYFPLDAFSPSVFSVGLINQFFDSYTQSEVFIDPDTDGFSINPVDINLKLIVDVEYEDLDENGDNITNTLEFKYDFDDIEWVTSPLALDLQNSPLNYSTFQENLVLDDTDFDGSTIDGCKLVGTHYTCHGWDDVTITGDLTTSNGHTVDIFGANEVRVIGESNVSPEIVLDIQSLLDYSQPMPRADNGFVRDFCKNELPNGFPFYEANRPNKSALQEYEAMQLQYEKSKELEFLTLELYPVPTSDVLYVSTSVALSNETIFVVDLSGRALNLPVQKINDQYYEINVSQLSAGSYYLNVTCNEGQSNKLFTKAK